MDANIWLKEYSNQKEELLDMIRRFWVAHNDETPSTEETLEDFHTWTGRAHKVYLIEKESTAIGFVHLGSRGAELDWIEDLFILPEYQGNGYGSEALRLTEEKVRTYSEAIYLEVSARNLSALKLYHRNGYDCLNTITLRKDFEPEHSGVIREEHLLGYSFEVR